MLLCELEEFVDQIGYFKISKECMAYLVSRGHSPKKVKRTVANAGKMTRIKTRVKK